VGTELQQSRTRTFGAFIDEVFAPWMHADQREDGAVSQLKTVFSGWLGDPMESLSAWRIESWRRERLEELAQPIDVDRSLHILASCLDKAVEWKIIPRNPVRGVGLGRAPEFMVELFAGGIGHAFLRHGWERVGVHWTWTLGPRAAIELPAIQDAADYMIKLEIAGIFRPVKTAFQRITVSVNKTAVGNVVCRGAASYEFFVPALLLEPTSSIEIEIGMADSARPADFRDTKDKRFLGLRISKFEFRPIIKHQPADPKPAKAGDDYPAVIQLRAALQDMASLGFNCEFGFIQRRAGAEPMNLFRWSYTPIDKLILALQEKLVGLNAKEALDIQLTDAGEYVAEYKAYGIRHHTFILEPEGGSVDRVRRNEYLRIGMLSKSLMNELSEQSKLFVYHDMDESKLPKIRELLQALNTFGKNTLLWIVTAPRESLIGSAEQIEPGLIIGYVEGFQRGPVSAISPFMASWQAVAWHAHKIWSDARSPEEKAG